MKDVVSKAEKVYLPLPEKYPAVKKILQVVSYLMCRDASH
jgi:hypothetical protein